MTNKQYKNLIDWNKCLLNRMDTLESIVFIWVFVSIASGAILLLSNFCK